jgi:hypothetical protein
LVCRSPDWLKYLEGTPEGYFVLGCMDRDEVFAVPVKFVEALLPKLNKTEKGEGSYWHITLNIDDGIVKLGLSKVGEKN